MKRPRFKSLVVSGFSGHEKTKQEIDTLYQSPVSDLVPVTGLEPVRGRPQGILSPWCLPFHHAGMFLSLFNLAPSEESVKHKLVFLFFILPSSAILTVFDSMRKKE